ncbi:hypothetical protein AJ85_16530 [Alkalihalobacillus alcalophilus ATCC 27647 = CGMCC 1.3604]|uniref:Uncharacterized protein n=1 Tax=Alkalihalobacillus alcalophilus ATCC 27647 = CGMCC 1.3604 TaxID=1218173 RepID=A0A094WM12_ALKAL|nr:hypothetical protein [Alkalihalobacillus alcalophilus]KGA98759.1 hypothetical protein BALCAV_0202305 [Alkalihalobacillus alcalophilus ATCC 27647 = CGMCC 1.3604]MED1560939.1 type II toxin-antitoxin system HicB family antitoxin [Alkalihalobacillus alcalophilus]THG92173.1 hypothetical protein AJ85_16530 [Alkalihalobacillus alcalophilus ATCC 27647 = CGMCC 1.3604]
MINGRSEQIHIVQPDVFSWTVRRVPNWMGGTEFMFEINGVDGCVSFGDTIYEAKKGLTDSLNLWIKKNGEHLLPEAQTGGQLIVLEQDMSDEEFTYINLELQTLHEKRG